MLLALVLAQLSLPNPAGPIFSQPSLIGQGAFFEAFSANGRGTKGVCSTTAPTGARGEVLTFTRASNGTCTKTASGGLATTGIANGDLVVLSNNVARVEYDSAGVLGLRVEAARTNINLRSEEWENVAYTLTGTGAAAPTRAADQATAPDGTLTADRINLAATIAAQTSIIRAAIGGTCAAAQCAYTVYVKGVSTSGTVDMGAWGSTVSNAPCAFVADSWTRCTRVATIAGTPGVYVGNDTANNGGTVRPAQDIYVWGGQQEAGAYATSYIPTTSAAVARAVEVATFPGPSAIATTSSMFASVQLIAAGAGQQTLVSQFNTAANFLTLRSYAGATYSTTSANHSTLAGALTGSVYRLGTYVSTGDVRETCRSGTCTSGSTATAYTRPATYLQVGHENSIGQLDGIVSRICLDPDPSRCR